MSLICIYFQNKSVFSRANGSTPYATMAYGRYLTFGDGPWGRVAPQICPLQLPIRACGGQSGELDTKNVSTKVYVGYVRPGAPS